MPLKGLLAKVLVQAGPPSKYQSYQISTASSNWSEASLA